MHAILVTPPNFDAEAIAYLRAHDCAIVQPDTPEGAIAEAEARRREAAALLVEGAGLHPLDLVGDDHRGQPDLHGAPDRLEVRVRQHDAAVDRVGTAADAGARAAGDHRRANSTGGSHARHHVVGGARHHQHGSHTGLLEQAVQTQREAT